MKSIIFYMLFLISFSYFSGVFAQQEDQENIKQYKINSMNYSNNLADGVEVKISGENLKECESITHKGIQLDVENPSFFYKQGELNGFVTIDCDGLESKYEYGFPFIESAQIFQEGDFLYLEILGKNFDNNSTLKIDGLNFEKILVSSKRIYGKISGKADKNSLYITSNNNDSNIVSFDYNFPSIEKIESKSGFLAGTKIYIHGENLGDYDMYVDNKKISDHIIMKSGIIEYVLPNKLGETSIVFSKYNITSNEVKISVKGEIPYLHNLFEKTNTESSTNQILEIYGSNFPFYDEEVVVYHNGEKQDIKNVSKDTIVVDNFDFLAGDNYIYVEVNGYRSNTLYKFKEVNLAYATDIVDVDFDDENRILTLGVENYIENEDKIYVDNKIAKTLSCYSSFCKIAIPKSHLVGKITIKRGDMQHKNILDFDYSTGHHPHIRKIIFEDEPKGFTKFTIYGNNLLGSDISGNNIFTLSNNNTPDVDISNETIKGRLPRNYELGNSQITVTKYSMRSSLDFSSDELENKTIKNAPFITHLTPINGSFLQSGNKLMIRGYGFNKYDKLIIDDISYPIDFSQGYDYPEIILDKNISTGYYDIFIESINGKKSNVIKKFISQSQNPQVLFTVNELNHKDLYYNHGSSDALFSMTINNGIEDIVISQLEFILQGSENFKDFGEVDLFLDGTKIDHGYVKEDGKILFLKEILLEKNTNDIKLEIKKADNFYAQGKYRISYLGHNTRTYKTYQQVFIDKKVLNGNYFTVGEKKVFSCYNSSSVNIECESVDNTASDSNSDSDNSTSINTTDNKSQESQQASDENSSQGTNTQEEQQEVRNSMEVKIDGLLTKLYISKTKKTTYEGLIYFKNLKTKLARIIDDIPDSHKDKELLLYLQKGVNDTYTKIFKEYVAEQKNK